MVNIEHLIETVRKHPILFDLSHKEYKNNRKKDKTWELIGTELNEDGEQLKRKWKNLRDTYAKYLKGNRTTTGQAAKKICKWQWASQMESFRPFLTFAKTSSNVEERRDCFNSEEAESITDEASKDTTPQNSTIETLVHSEPQPLVHSEPQPQTSNSKIKTRLKEAAESSTSVNSVIEYLRNKEKRSPMDAVDLIFHGYAQALKNFTPRRQADVKIKIATIMAEAEFAHEEEQAHKSQDFSGRHTTNVTENNMSQNTPQRQSEDYHGTGIDDVLTYVPNPFNTHKIT